MDCWSPRPPWLAGGGLKGANMEKSISELRADKAELDARIAEAKRKEKRGAAYAKLEAWADKHESVLTTTEGAALASLLRLMDPNPLMGARA